MARRFARRRKRVTWFVSNGTEIAAQASVLQDNFVATPFNVGLNWGGLQDRTHEILPINLFDKPNEPDPTINVAGTVPSVFSLADVVGSEYVTERIVGNCYATAYNTSNPSAVERFACLLALGVFVARADSEDQNLPLGGDIAADFNKSSAAFNPLDLETAREPWMFRRTWMLSFRNQAVDADNDAAVEGTSALEAWQGFPKTTAGYHGIHTGPFFDIKSKRRVGQDDRLFMVLAATGVPFPATPQEVGNYFVDAVIDLRILGRLVRARQQSAF